MLSGGNSLASERQDLSNIVSRVNPPDSVITAFKDLWSSKSIQAAFEKRNELQLIESTEYFMDSMDRLLSKDYVPTDDDILRVRVRTSRISKIEFTIHGKNIEMIDVGGQRGKRKKWIHYFDSITAVLFVVSISEYDQRLEEDESVNRMVDSMELFEQTLNNKMFCLSPFIVFFNKYDLFVEKIKHKSIKETFGNYNGKPHAAEESLNWLVDRYLNTDQTRKNKRGLYPHTTTATDTHLFKNVFASVQDIIISEILKPLSVL